MKNNQKWAAIHMQVQTVLTLIITGAVVYIGYNAAKIPAMQVTIDALKEDLRDIKNQGYVTEKGFELRMKPYDDHFEYIDAKLKETEGRTYNLLGRVQKIENTIKTNN